MVTWYLTIKPPNAMSGQHCELKLWRQVGNSLLLPAKCWLPLHLIRASSWRRPMLSLESQGVFKNCFCISTGSIHLFFYITNHLLLITWNLNCLLGFTASNLNVSGDFVATLRFSENKIHCSMRDQSLSARNSTGGLLSPVFPWRFSSRVFSPATEIM